MKTNYYKCTLLSDVVVNAQTATEGQQKSLDYIPGANFLGLVAGKLYWDDSIGDDEDINNERLILDDCYPVFHSGDVRFGDALIAEKVDDTPGNEKYTQCLKVPASWFHKKGETLSDTVMVHHLISQSQRDEMTQSGIQLKQARSGYFNPETKKLGKLGKTFNQKSAHDRKNRRSEEGKMFGYESFPQGAEFIFEVNYPDEFENDSFDGNKVSKIETIEGALTGDQRLGRSKNAQYGLVNIKKISPKDADRKEETQEESQNEKAQIVIYAKSDLCFFDQYGEPSLQPTPCDLGLSDDNQIFWEESQVRTRSYAPWNGKRRTRDADRIVIEKGSVIVAKGNFGDNIKSCVGSYKAEGLGQIIINPDFLKTRELENNEKKELCNKWQVEHSDKKWQILNFSLSDCESQERVSRSIDLPKGISDLSELKVLEFLEYKNKELLLADLIRTIAIKFKAKHRDKYKEISNSQWGEIRSRANKATTKTNLVSEITTFLSHGVASNKWQKSERSKTLTDAITNNFKDFVLDTESKETDFALIEANMPVVVAMLANQMSKK